MAKQHHPSLSGDRLYRLLTENMDDVVWTLDKELRFTYVSPSVFKLRGFTPEEAMAERVEETLTPESLPLILKEMARITQTREEDFKNAQSRFEVEQYRKDGSTVWVEIVTRPMFDDEDEHIGYVGVSRDISQRRAAEQALKDSEVKYRTVFEGANDGVFLLKDYRVAEVNRRAEKMFGLTVEQFQGLSPDEYSSPEQADGRPSNEAARDKIDQALAGENPVFEWIHRRADGTNFDTEVGLSRLDLPEGPHVLAVVRDISARKKSEARLLRSEAFVSSILRAAPSGIGLVRERIMTWVSPQLARMLDYEPEELVGRSSRVLYETEEEFARVGREKYRDIAETGLGEVDTHWLTKKGEVREIHLRSAPMNPEVMADGVIFAATDITDRVAGEAERARLQARLLQSQKLEAIGTLAGGIAHDFNNILAAIIGYAELTQGDLNPDSRTAGFQEQILKAADRARQLISKIISFSRPRRMERSPVRLAPVIDEALSLLRASAPVTVEIFFDNRAGRQDMALADPSQIHQMIMNLATNALQAMENGGRLEVSLAKVDLDSARTAALPDLETGEYLEIKVSDTGVGMSRATADRVFEPFFSRRGSGRGSGMGLSVVHGLVRGHGGAISLDSAPGLGTTFTVLLPRLKDGQAVPTEGSSVEPELRGREKIVFVDDEAPLVDVATRSLNRLGYRAEGFTSPQRALEAVGQSPDSVDLIITDYTMPGLTGLDLVRELKAAGYSGPIIICTGFNKLLDEDQAARAGISKMLMKPLTGAELARQVRELLDN